MIRAVRLFAALAGIALISACAPKEDLTLMPPAMGDFSLGYNIAIAEGVQQGPLSRRASEQELETALKAAVDERFGRYSGAKLYHLGMKIEAYALAMPGIPVAFKPKSILVLSVTVWDDAAGKKINTDPKQIIAFESFSGETFIGSGLTQNKATQLKNLSYNAARKIDIWLHENAQWFGGVPTKGPKDTNEEALKAAAGAPPAAVPAPGTAAPGTPATGTGAPGAAAPVFPPLPAATAPVPVATAPLN